MGWTVQGSNPGGGEIFCTCPDRLGAHLASYTMGTGSFPRVKRPGRGVDHPPHLVSSWPVLGWTVPLPLPPSLGKSCLCHCNGQGILKDYSAFEFLGTIFALSAYISELLNSYISFVQKTELIYVCIIHKRLSEMKRPDTYTLGMFRLLCRLNAHNHEIVTSWGLFLLILFQK
jgi:hypothetical protein